MMPLLNTYRGENNPDGVRKIFNVTLRYTIIKGFILTVIARVKDSIFYILFFVLCGSLFGINGMWIDTMICPPVAFLFALLLIKLRFKDESISA